MIMKQYYYFQAPIGELLLVESEGKLEQLVFPNQHQGRSPNPDWVKNKSVFEEVCRQLEAYFSGKLQQFSLELNPSGTDFQKKVWKALCTIPFGTTINYGELAEKIDNPKASRAVGLANGKNPIPIIIPCHRVIGKNRTLTGFGGGLEIKTKLLELEGHKIDNDLVHTKGS